MPWTRQLWMMLAVVLTVALTTVIFAPAAWLGDFLAKRSTVRFTDPQGTLWNGSAMVGFSNGRRTLLAPGRIRWRLAFLPLFTGTVALTLEATAFDARFELRGNSHGIDVEGGTGSAPAAILSALGAPFNTVQPGGELRIRWSALRLKPGLLEGSVQIDWLEAQSALARIAPLGNFRMTLKGRGPDLKLQLETLRGPLLLEGEGVLQENRLRFNGTASAEEAMRPALNTLIGVLGPRQGDKVILRLDG